MLRQLDLPDTSRCKPHSLKVPATQRQLCCSQCAAQSGVPCDLGKSLARPRSQTQSHQTIPPTQSRGGMIGSERGSPVQSHAPEKNESIIRQKKTIPVVYRYCATHLIGLKYWTRFIARVKTSRTCARGGDMALSHKYFTINGVRQADPIPSTTVHGMHFAVVQCEEQPYWLHKELPTIHTHF